MNPKELMNALLHKTLIPIEVLNFKSSDACKAEMFTKFKDMDFICKIQQATTSFHLYSTSSCLEIVVPLKIL